MVILLKRLCHENHLLAGTFYDDTKSTSEEARRSMLTIMSFTDMNQCGICGSVKMKFTEEETGFQTILEAAGLIDERLRNEASLREKFRNEGKVLDRKKN